MVDEVLVFSRGVVSGQSEGFGESERNGRANVAGDSWQSVTQSAPPLPPTAIAHPTSQAHAPDNLLKLPGAAAVLSR